MESRIHREVSVRLGGEEDYSSLAYGVFNNEHDANVLHDSLVKAGLAEAGTVKEAWSN